MSLTQTGLGMIEAGKLPVPEQHYKIENISYDPRLYNAAGGVLAVDHVPTSAEQHAGRITVFPPAAGAMETAVLAVAHEMWRFNKAEGHIHDKAYQYAQGAQRLYNGGTYIGPTPVYESGEVPEPHTRPEHAVTPGGTPNARPEHAVAPESVPNPRPNNQPHQRPSDRQPPALENKNLGMKIGESVRGNIVKYRISLLQDQIEFSASWYKVDPNLIRATIYEEQTHQFPFEADLEALGFGKTVGLGQVTEGLHGFTREQLLDVTQNINAIAQHYNSLMKDPLIDPNFPIQSLGTVYNCGKCKEITPYGRRIGEYYKDFSR